MLSISCHIIPFTGLAALNGPLLLNPNPQIPIKLRLYLRSSYQILRSRSNVLQIYCPRFNNHHKLGPAPKPDYFLPLGFRSCTRRRSAVTGSFFGKVTPNLLFLTSARVLLARSGVGVRWASFKMVGTGGDILVRGWLAAKMGLEQIFAERRQKTKAEVEMDFVGGVVNPKRQTVTWGGISLEDYIFGIGGERYLPWASWRCCALFFRIIYLWMW